MTTAKTNSAHKRLAARLRGQLLSDQISRGQYATDASVYQIVPQAVAIPESVDDVLAVIEYARGEGIAVVPRGGGTSCLLYTSPSPRDLSTSRMPSSA